jgi:hypothetical protein
MSTFAAKLAAARVECERRVALNPYGFDEGHKFFAFRGLGHPVSRALIRLGAEVVATFGPDMALTAHFRHVENPERHLSNQLALVVRVPGPEKHPGYWPEIELRVANGRIIGQTAHYLPQFSASFDVLEPDGEESIKFLDDLETVVAKLLAHIPQPAKTAEAQHQAAA